MAAARALLGLNIEGVDGHLLGGDENLHTYVHQRKLGVAAWDHLDIDANNEGNWGTAFHFEPALGPDYMGKVQFRFLVGAFASTSATALDHFPRHADYFGYQAIETATAKFGSQTQQVLEGEDMYILHVLFAGVEDLLDDCVLGGLQANTAQRYQNATASSTEVIVPLPFYWTFSFATYMPYSLTFLSQPMRISIKLVSRANAVETDGTDLTGGTLSEVVLRMEAIYVNESVQGEMFEERGTLAADSPLGVDGYARMCPVVRRQKDQTITAGTSEQNVKITAIKEPVINLIAGVRATADLPTGTFDDGWNRFNFQEISNRTIKSQNTTLRSKVTGNYLKNFERQSKLSSSADNELLFDTFSFAPEALASQMAYINFNGASDMRYYFTTASSVTGQIDHWTIGPSIYSVGSNSELVMLFT